MGVQRFQAEVYKSKSKEFEILQTIIETENRINYLVGRYPQVIIRKKSSLFDTVQTVVNYGVQTQLLNNRPDIKQAELELEAAKLDVKVAKSEFIPSLGISAGVGLNAFKPQYLTTIPESLLYNLIGDITGHLINRNAIKAAFLTANSIQIKALFNYEKTVLNAYLEVSNQVSRISNLDKSYNLKTLNVDALNKSIIASYELFK